MGGGGGGGGASSEKENIFPGTYIVYKMRVLYGRANRMASMGDCMVKSKSGHIVAAHIRRSDTNTVLYRFPRNRNTFYCGICMKFFRGLRRDFIYILKLIVAIVAIVAIGIYTHICIKI